MKIVITGGGSGGHFYPLMAVIDEVNRKAFEKGMSTPQVFYFGKDEFNSQARNERGIVYKWVPSGKNRLYFSLLNYVDIFKVFGGVVIAFFRLIFVYPDVIFSKGGHDSVPTCIAAKILGIPIILHDSDSVPGRSSLLISRIAYRVAVSYAESIKFYSNQNIIAHTGQPILRKYLPSDSYSRVYNSSKKTILITAGSQGSVKLNDIVLELLPQLVAKYNIIHQCGGANYEDVKLRSDYILQNYDKSNYTLAASFDFSTIYPKVDLVISRAGSTIFEFLAWQLPSILIPIDESISRDQFKNALNISGKGYAKIISENNLSPSVLLNSILNILENKDVYTEIVTNIQKEKRLDASSTIADEILNIASNHS